MSNMTWNFYTFPDHIRRNVIVLGTLSQTSILNVKGGMKISSPTMA